MAARELVAYTVEDLDVARQLLGAHVELDPWGNLIVTPASHQHDYAVAVLHTQLTQQLPATCQVLAHSPAWKVPGGSGYTMLPDITVLPADWRVVGEVDLRPRPFLIAEVTSPSTRIVDRGRKLEDYRQAATPVVLLVDLPGLAPVEAPTVELWEGSSAIPQLYTEAFPLLVDVGEQTIEVRIDPLLLPPRW